MKITHDQGTFKTIGGKNDQHLDNEGLTFRFPGRPGSARTA
jgi:hypothetical protein